jgi:glycyl-tRNA synthetase beta subunit
MVMDEDLDRRRNRLALLDGLRALFSSIADISKLPSPERS